MAGQRQAVLAGHHDVADDQIDGLRAQHRARLGGAGGIDDGKALRAQIFGERLADRRFVVDQQDRSEEHTSELKSLMRTSYAVFCLKKKKKRKDKLKQTYKQLIDDYLI